MASQFFLDFGQQLVGQLRGVDAHEPAKVKDRYLVNALQAVASGKPVAVRATKSIGCGIKVRNKTIHLTPKEFNLLGVLVRNAGRVITRTDLVKEAWGPEYGDAIDSLKLYVHYLRQKLEVDPDHPEYIMTLRGVGYRFASR